MERGHGLVCVDLIRVRQAVGRAFEHVAVSARLKVATVAEATRPEPGGSDVLARARISRERDQAALRFAKDRDLGRLEATVARGAPA